MKTNSLKNRSKLLLIAGMLAVAVSGSAQSGNLLTNGNFESFQSQAPHYQQISGNGNWNQNTFALGWTQATYGSPDLFTDFSTSSINYACGNITDAQDNPGTAATNWNGYACYPQVCPLENLFGEQTPHSGDNYLGIRCLTSYEYIQTSFSNLTVGQCYRLSFWVSRSDLSTEAIRIQAALSDGTVEDFTTSNGLLDPYVVPNITVYTSPTFITSKTTWTKITFEFKALGGEDHLTIGMFNPDGIPNPADPSGPQLPTVMTDGTAGMCDDQNGNDPCSNCASETDAYYYIDDVMLEAIAGSGFTPDLLCTFTTNNPNISGNYTNKNILISGSVILSGNATFDNCEVRCNAGTTITVPSGKTFTITNTTNFESGCDAMWNGIYVNGGSLVMRGSTISDALKAISFNNSTSTWQIYRDASNNFNTFSRNLVDIEFNTASSGSNVLKATFFDHAGLLKDPTQGIGGYGTNNIVCNGPGNGVYAETIGGSTSNDGCVFIGGQNGIVASKFNLKVENCTFSGQANVAIDFQNGVVPTTLWKLTVVSSTFLYARGHIYAHNHVDLTVQSSSFSYAQQNSVEWSNNHDGELLIGDASNAALGNTFTNNGWYAVVAMHNTSIQTNVDYLALNQLNSTSGPNSTTYTSIIVGNNTINCLPSSSGIQIAEWQLGQDVSYHELNITTNLFNTAFNGVHLSNVRGFRGSDLDPLITAPENSLKFNMTYLSTQFAANAVGIRIMNSPGLEISENGVSSDNWVNYTNSGISMQNAPYSEVYGNIINAGVCIAACLDMYESNLHCNWFGAYSTGFYMGYTWLRAGSSYTHGSPSYEQYNNLVPYGMYPWNSDIHVDNSDVEYNQWIWNGASTNLTIWRTGSTGSGPLISSYTGTDRCDDGFPGYPVFDDNVDITFSSNPVAQWLADYNYEVQRRVHADGSDAVASANIKAIIDIEGLMTAGEFEDALNELASFTPDNDIEENYKTVLTVFATLGDEGSRTTSDTEKGNLIDVAEQSSLTGGPAVTMARAYLEARYYLHYADPRALADQEIHGTASLSSPCTMEPTSNTWLSFISEDGFDLEIEGTYISADGTFIFDPQETAYYENLYPTTEFRIFSKPGSQYTGVSFDYHTLSDWLTASPVNIDLAGVSAETDTIDEEQIVDLYHYTEWEINDYTYSVGSVETENGSDFLIEKRDRHGLIWTRSWHGPVEESEDAATCLYVDAEENVYVAGKVYNGDDFDCQILKYDAEGNLIWNALFIDEERWDDEPDAIYFDDTDGSVQVEGGCGGRYRYIKVWQCLPGSERLGQEPQDELMQIVAPATFYPSPSNGKLNVVLNEEQGGLFELLNLEGQVVYTQQITKTGEIELPPSIVDGVYLIKFTGEGEPYYQKLMIYRPQ